MNPLAATDAVAIARAAAPYAAARYATAVAADCKRYLRQLRSHKP